MVISHGARLVAIAAVAVSCLVVLIASSVPNLIFIEQPLLDLLARKAGHVVIFTTMVFAGGVGLHGMHDPRWTAAMLVLGATAIALADELNQRHVAGRLASMIDVGLDLVGALIGAAAYLRIARRTRTR